MNRRRLWSLSALVLLVLLFAGWRWHAWSRMINAMMPADSRPGRVVFAVEPETAGSFEQLANELAAQAGEMGLAFDHVERFRDAGILVYEGPHTCLNCHSDVTFENAAGRERSEPLMANLTDSSHYRFFSDRHPNVWGFNGELADPFPMGKINRPCPKPGSFAMTAWAELVVTDRGDTLSEGCGQCHIGGQYQAPLGEMMPMYATLPEEKEAIDCLVCHSAVYDMNRKVVIQDDNGRLRWGQDRSMRAAMTVTSPTAQACLRCHQHNFGGDIYVDGADPSFMPSILQPGADRPRVMHPGSKRGTPYSPSWDVHAAAGMSCLDCHATEGHRIAKGLHTTTMMANDLPQREVTCVACHDAEPHASAEVGDALNAHVERIACVTCHIPSLHEDNASRRDFAHTEWEEHPGIHVYHDTVKETGPGEGIDYVWWNGDATFLGNPIGDHPDGGTGYRFYDAEHRWPEFADYDYEAWYEEVMRPIARRKPSKLYAIKRFNGRQHIDLQNIGPFGGMFVPYNLPTYYRTGDPDAAARAEMDKSMMGMMYGWMFKVYMLDKFMSFMDIDGWNTKSYDDVRAGENVEARWIPTDARLEISHGIRLEGALTCADCHSENGVMDFQRLGYPADRVAGLQSGR
jgi:hypothetical protein